MKYYISHKSALECWRLFFVALLDARLGTSAWLGRPVGKPPQPDVSLLQKPLHILLSSQLDRRSRPQVQQHVCSADLPADCFVDLAEDATLCSPELVFLQMAGRLTLIELILLGFELCGAYSMPAQADAQPAPPDAAEGGRPGRKGKGFNTRPPLTSVARLRAFLGKTSGMKGRKRAMRALRYIMDGSASPMETRLAMLLTLPHSLGGYGLPKAELNHRVTPARRDRRGAGQAYYVCDMFLPEHGTAREYDSDLIHAGSERIARDSVRRNALAMLGITVYTVGAEQIQGEAAMNRMAYILARAMGWRTQVVIKDHPQRKRRLRRQLHLRR